MIDHPLHDCRLKVARAKQQFDTLQGEIAKFAENNPYRCRASFDEKTGKHTLDFGEPPALPRDWGPPVGEIAHNCRSALDYLIHLLVYKAGGQPHKRTAFPIAEDESGYRRLIKKGVTYRDVLLDGLPEDWRKKIDGFQPYHEGDQAYRHPLARLADITNADKHRTLHAAYTSIDLPMHVVNLPTGDPIKHLRIEIPADIAVEAESTRGHRSQGIAIGFARKVQVDWRLGIEVIFGGDNLARLFSLADLRDVVAASETIIESFRPESESD